MALYSYKAINDQGKTTKGMQDTANVVDLELRLKRVGLDLIQAREDEKKSAFGVKKIKRTDLITLFFNMDQLVRSGVPLLECLADFRDSMDDPQFREIIASMVESIGNGKKLSQAMAEHPEAFDKIFVSLTHAGEESGRLADVFLHLTESLKWQDEMAAQTKNMMIYPVFVGTVVIAITFFLMIYLVPQLVGFIKGMGQEIPLQTRLLLATSGVFVDYWYVMLAFPVVLFAAFKLSLVYNPGLQYHLDKLKLNIRPTGPILRKIILARFANTFAMMYGSGIAILDCIANSRDLVGNQVIARSLEQVAHEIESGKNLTQSFQNTGVFPPLVIRMLKVGEATGQLDHALRNVSYFYDRDVKDSIKKVQVMIEPTMTIILGLLLGWVMLAVLSPIYDIISKVKM
ncbi:MAG: type II secretion system F family protein [Betaproteobacteria bacterium]|nr:type II secretion system F family protein [Betaproteobacteria bacterium]